jgi:hypothetical protein
VVWLESVIGLYDSRQEVPLAMVQSSTISTPLLGRILKYGNVIAQAYMGKVTFRYVAEPYQVKAVLDKWQKMVSVRVQKQDTEAMERVIRRKIDPLETSHRLNLFLHLLGASPESPQTSR